MYDLSEEVERNLLQVYLKQLSLSNPSLAVNYFNRKSHLWIGQKEVLKVFFDSIPLESSLKLELLFLLSEWNREMWLDMVNLPDRDIDTHYRLLVDARARLFVDKTMLYRFVGDKREP